MAFVKNDVTDEDLDKLFNENDASSFIKKKELEDKHDNSLISDELDVKSPTTNKIERPLRSQMRDEIKDSIREEEKREESLLKSVSEKVISITGQVTSKIFNEIARVRQEAYLEEYRKSQNKLPVIKENAKIKLYSGQDECKFHVYKPYQMIDSDHMMTCCKYCSESKIFTLQEWMKYQLENKQYI